MTTHVRIKQTFNRSTDKELIATSAAVFTGLTDNMALQNPPVPLKDLEAAHDSFVAAVGATATGGTLATADKNNKRSALILVLRKLAHYVEDNCNNDLAVLVSSGFRPKNNSKAPQFALDKPAILGVENGSTTQLVVKVQRIFKARCYEVRTAAVSTSNGPGPWITAGIFNNTKSIVVTGQPGTNYAIQVRAIGGSTIAPVTGAIPSCTCARKPTSESGQQVHRPLSILPSLPPRPFAISCDTN